MPPTASRDRGRTGVVFVHGLFSSPSAWDELGGMLSRDADLSHRVDLLYFRYSSPVVELRPTRAIPTFDTLADALRTFLDVHARSYDRLVVVTHSQGGLVTQRYLAQEVGAGRAHGLRRIRSIVLFACPNSGSEFMLAVRPFLPWRHPHERELRPMANSVARTLRTVLDQVVYASEVTAATCPVEIVAYAGEQDRIVTPASAMAAFPSNGVLPGDHSSIIRPADTDASVFLCLKYHVLAVLDGRTGPAAGAAAPAPGPGPAVRPPDLNGIVKELFTLPEVRNEVSRRQVVELLPPNIQAAIVASTTAKLQVVALVQACARFGTSGKLALLETLELVLPEANPHDGDVLARVDALWPTDDPMQLL